jgi:hypothetical protein
MRNTVAIGSRLFIFPLVACCLLIACGGASGPIEPYAQGESSMTPNGARYNSVPQLQLVPSSADFLATPCTHQDDHHNYCDGPNGDTYVAIQVKESDGFKGPFMAHSSHDKVATVTSEGPGRNQRLIVSLVAVGKATIGVLGDRGAKGSFPVTVTETDLHYTLTDIPSNAYEFDVSTVGNCYYCTSQGHILPFPKPKSYEFTTWDADAPLGTCQMMITVYDANHQVIANVYGTPFQVRAGVVNTARDTFPIDG